MKSLLAIALLQCACKVPDPPPVGEGFTDNFDRVELGSDYRPTSTAYQLKNGALVVSLAYNHPLWLRKKLPADAVIEFDCWADSPTGDIKVEFWGDGQSFAESRVGQYTATGYVAVMGGWNNSKSILARGNEHGAGLQQRTTPRVEPKKRYHWKIEKRGNQITWWVDDMATPFLVLTDKQPIPSGYFGFNNWKAGTGFDNLTIKPLP